MSRSVALPPSPAAVAKSLAPTAALCTLAVALITGLPTDVLPNPWFTRMTPVRPLDLVAWPVSSALTGMLLATYVAPATRALAGDGRAGAGLGAGALTWLAIGCPVCNKIVVTLMGASAALTWFGPLQPLLALAAIVLAGAALALRLRAIGRACTGDGCAAQSPDPPIIRQSSGRGGHAER